ncbi:hypothetical protein [Chitinophaga tropicalis]|uniref:Uncharacterized protein n=1 Tax=Chitinophaga tropicalis TaxID=2683588 RepID=A0A7K1U538_9BACT|nr:hypothetical protein [Chitinophaga tropicalis]MVT09449.1 hypothetical protein [Chitinophaga tropicalis]
MIYYLLTILVSQFFQDTSINGPIRIEGFGCVAWKTDSLGCQQVRYKMWKVLIDNKQKIIGQKRAAVEKLLGPPNSTLNNNEITFYFLNIGYQCRGAKKEEYNDVETFKFGVDYKGDKAVEVFTMIP